MSVKLSLRDLNSNSCSPHLIITYTCRVTITLRVCGVTLVFLLQSNSGFRFLFPIKVASKVGDIPDMRTVISHAKV